MKALNDLNFKKINTIITEQYDYKNNFSVVIEHIYTKDNPQGKWKYYGNSIWEQVPTFNSLEDLINYLESK